MNAAAIFEGSDAAATRAFYASLEECGPVGVVAMNLLRAQKASNRAKKYRGGIAGVGSFSDMAYKRKNWAIGKMVDALLQYKILSFGWGLDHKQTVHRWVIYIDLPDFGQVSFHTIERGKGPDYRGKWDGLHVSRERILGYCDRVLETRRSSIRTLFDELSPERF